MKFIIESQSGIQGTCLQGEGETEQQAWEDAFGPKPWTKWQKKCAKNSWSREVSEEELENLKGQ